MNIKPYLFINQNNNLPYCKVSFKFEMLYYLCMIYHFFNLKYLFESAFTVVKEISLRK